MTREREKSSQSKNAIDEKVFWLATATMVELWLLSGLVIISVTKGDSSCITNFSHSYKMSLRNIEPNFSLNNNA